MKSKWIILSELILLFAVIISIFRDYPSSDVIIHKMSIEELESVHAFTEALPFSGLDSKVVLSRYDSIRTKALNMAQGCISQRNQLNIAFNILCVFSIVASFIVSILGANKGVLFDPNQVQNQLAAINADTRFRKRVIIYSALAILATTISNRVGAVSDKTQSTGYEILSLINTTDTKISSALDLHEAKTITDEFELNVSKY